MPGRGGRREGAGRPRGSGKYGEPTKAVRVPLSMVDELPRIIELWQQWQRETRLRVIPGGKRDEVQTPVARLAPRTARVFPLYSERVAAGMPVLADSYIDEEVDLNQYLSRHPERTFLVPVTGESMIGAGIYPGDLLVVDPQEEPLTGKIVIAAVDNEVTVKRLQVRGKQVTLLPENPDFAPIEISNPETFHIYGVIVSSIRRF